MPLDTPSSASKASLFRFPGGDARTVVIGATGSGKTTLGAWLLSHQRFDKRPWIIVDFKGEELFDRVGFPPIQRLKLGKMPGRSGLYLVTPLPSQDEQLEAWLWKIWARGNVGLFVDEAALMPDAGGAWKAIQRQGRSKRIPVIACTQRPVGIDRECFTEASFVSVFRLADERDYKVVSMFTRKAPLGASLPPFHSWWYDVGQDRLLRLSPAPSPAEIAGRVRAAAPYRFSIFG
jgi:hypothetical protein